MHIPTSSTLVLLGALLISCTAPDGGDLEPGPRMKIRKGCLRTACQARRVAESRQCSDCTSACFSAGYSCDPADACEYSCEATPDCSDHEKNECVAEGFEVTLPNNPSDAIATGCRRLLRHVEACGVDPGATDRDCDRFAALERPEMAAQYECVAALSCDALLNDSGACPVAPSNLGDAICTGIAGVCGSGCTEETRLWLNDGGAWWRDDVIRAGTTCAEQAICDDAVDCFEAWTDALLGF